MANYAGPETAALIQRGALKQPGFYGSQEMKPSNDSFNQAASIGAQLSGVAANLKNSPLPPANYKRTQANYILTDQEKAAIQAKSQELSSYGVIPYDTLEQFFYILAAIEQLSDLVYIANVTGVPELGDQKYIRNIIGITQIRDIYKVGYLSQGVASIVNKFHTKYATIQNYDNPSRSSSGSTFNAASLGLALGVIGPAIIGTAYNYNGATGALSGAPNLSQTSITNSINVFSTLSSGGNLSPNDLSVVNNRASSMSSLATSVGPGTINQLLTQSPLGGAFAALGSLGAVAAGMLLSKSGGQAVGGLMSEILTGNRISTSTRANNPMLTPPSYAGKSFFGEAPVSLPAIDQVFCRRVGAFGTSQGGSGVVSFGMQNFASMGGSSHFYIRTSRNI